MPGLNTRKARTTVELKPGQTLAIAGLMQLTLDGQTSCPRAACGGSDFQSRWNRQDAESATRRREKFKKS